MENKKKLCVTCDVCDARKVQESTLAAYASVRIVCWPASRPGSC